MQQVSKKEGQRSGTAWLNLSSYSSRIFCFLWLFYQLFLTTLTYLTLEWGPLLEVVPPWLHVNPQIPCLHVRLLVRILELALKMYCCCFSVLSPSPNSVFICPFWNVQLTNTISTQTVNMELNSSGGGAKFTFSKCRANKTTQTPRIENKER